MKAAPAPWVLAAALAAGSGACGAAPPVSGPYKHAPQAIDAATHRMATAAEGAARPLPEALPPGRRAVTWAFAVGECGAERWGEGIETERFAQANVGAFVQAGVDYIVSTGGQGNQFTCATDEGMERFVARYDSPRLVGLDFDIEAGQSDASIDSLVRRIKAAQQRRPRLRISFTLPSFAASDGSRRSLNGIGERVLRAVRRHGLRDPHINLMVMDYGAARAGRCVLKPTPEGPRCDMGRSALQAALNLHQRYRVPLDRIELTAMIGVNDVVENVFTLEDAQWLGRAVREHGLAGLHWWSLDRDTPCAAPVPGASPTCSGLAQAPHAFAEAFAKGLSDVRE